MAKAIKAYTGHTVIGYEIDGETLCRAQAEGTVDFAGNDQLLTTLDLLLIALYPGRRWNLSARRQIECGQAAS